MSIKDDFLLIVVDRGLLDIRIQVVMPSLSALLASPSPDLVHVSQLLCYECPSLSSILRDQPYDCIVLLYFK